MNSITWNEQVHVWIAIHGLFMFVAWGMLVPAGIYIAKYCKNCLNTQWLVYHRICMASALVLSVSASTIAIIVGDNHLDRPCTILGPVINLALLSQVIWGTLFVRISPPNFSQIAHERSRRDRFAQFAGPLILILAISNALLGLISHGALPRYVPIIGAIYLIAVAALFTKAEYDHVDRNDWSRVPVVIDDGIDTRVGALTNPMVV